MSTTVLPPRGKRQEAHVGTTNASGNVSVVYNKAFLNAPMIAVQLISPASARVSWTATSESVTGCTINVKTPAIVSVIGVDVVGSTLNNVNGQQIRLIATEM